MCIICKAAKQRVLVPRDVFTKALQIYHQEMPNNCLVVYEDGGWISNFYQFIGMSYKDIRKYQLQSHRVKVPPHIAAKIHCITTSLHWRTLIKAIDAKYK